jgi:multidrug transporter EmrE-like cation transporter
MIDNYVKSKLFDDDVYDPVESAYREAIVDHSTSGSSIGKKDGKMGGMEGAYPTLLAETANAALGQQRSVSSLLSSSSTSSSSNVLSKNKDTKNDGLTSLLITAADFLQTKLGISASTSYSIVAGVGIVGICVVPAGLGVLYQSIQRMQIDRSEMKMYGKIAE